MRGTRLLLVPAVAAIFTSPAVAEQGKAPMGVSVTVVRSCTINSDTPTVIVNCGRRPQTVRVTEQATPAPGPAPSVADTKAVTIEF
jgi:hypothetical protein